jgi:hypothetical protein
MEDAATVARVAERAQRIVASTHTLLRAVDAWVSDSDYEGEQYAGRLAIADEFRRGVGRQRDEKELFEIELDRMIKDELPGRLPAAFSQVELCVQAARRSWDYSDRLREELRSALAPVQTGTEFAKQRRTLASSVTDHGPYANADFEIVTAASETARRAVLPSHHELLYLLRLDYHSPLEVTLSITGAVAGTVAVLNQILDFRIKYRTRDEEALAVKTKLEREIAENVAARDASRSIRDTYSNHAGQLGISEIEVTDDLDDQSTDDFDREWD